MEAYYVTTLPLNILILCDIILGDKTDNIDTDGTLLTTATS